ncbi:hypothetical protein CMV_008215 [Castanea mollissima]|uniref:Uncharacterized protein n=1 Tax=Castanea mollissima TaxID=60419 RepID=A0A8J4VS14_9ROSI|nr:hypothetical protein CMV_008215 [Castanea mollissima]
MISFNAHPRLLSEIQEGKIVIWTFSTYLSRSCTITVYLILGMLHLLVVDLRTVFSSLLVWEVNSDATKGVKQWSCFASYNYRGANSFRKDWKLIWTFLYLSWRVCVEVLVLESSFKAFVLGLFNSRVAAFACGEPKESVFSSLLMQGVNSNAIKGLETDLDFLVLELVLVLNSSFMAFVLRENNTGLETDLDFSFLYLSWFWSSIAL